MSNAIKYSPNGKNTTVGCVLINNRLQVSVQDEGMGIRKKDMKNLFERYKRVETEFTEKIAGYGIGLYLSAEIIRRHNGDIWVESEPGQGSTFYFNLPWLWVKGGFYASLVCKSSGILFNWSNSLNLQRNFTFI